MIHAQIIADSINSSGNRLTTFVLSYPRYIHAEVMTHRMFSRNAASSRAIPTNKLLHKIWSDPAVPIWTENKPGMSSNVGVRGIRRDLANMAWLFAGKVACITSWFLNKLGVHKQHANRCMEPWWPEYSVIVTATDFGNFFNLRISEEAQPEIHMLADSMWMQLQHSKPKLLEMGEWHMPFVTDEERNLYGIEVCKKLSVARCARVSYMNHDNTEPNPTVDIKLHDRLLQSLHMSPFEHQARALSLPTKIGNLTGWEQYRKMITLEYRPDYSRR